MVLDDLLVPQRLLYLAAGVIRGSAAALGRAMALTKPDINMVKAMSKSLKSIVKTREDGF